VELEEEELEEADGDEIWVLINGGANMEICGRDGRVPLHCAAMTGNTAATAILLQAGANIEAQDNLRQRPVHYAAYSGSFKILKILLNKGADVGARDSYGRTALHLAAMAGRNRVVNLLVNSPAVEKNAKDRVGSTPLHLAVLAGRTRMVNLLAKSRDVEKNAKDHDHHTAIHLASIHALDEILQAILAACDVEFIKKLLDLRNRHGSTALHLAVENGHQTTAKLLLEYDAPIDAPDDFGNKRLILQSYRGTSTWFRSFLIIRTLKSLHQVASPYGIISNLALAKPSTFAAGRFR
jgi:ankyrin repeat protein